MSKYWKPLLFLSFGSGRSKPLPYGWWFSRVGGFSGRWQRSRCELGKFVSQTLHIDPYGLVGVFGCIPFPIVGVDVPVDPQKRSRVDEDIDPYGLAGTSTPTVCGYFRGCSFCSYSFIGDPSPTGSRVFSCVFLFPLWGSTSPSTQKKDLG